MCPESIHGAQSSTLCGANDECAAGCLDHILCDDMQFVNTQDPLICTNNLWSSRKLPWVMRLMAAMACVSVKSALSRDKPSWRQWRVNTKVSSSSCSGR